MTTQLTEEQLKMLIRDSVREGINTEFMKFRALLFPYISKGEQKEIERLYKEPSHKVAKSYKIEI